MKWAFRIRRKITAALLLAVVFVIMFAKNVVDNKYVTQLGTSFSSVYEDRLVVESYIYRLSDHLFRKKIMIDTCTLNAAAALKKIIRDHNESMDKIIQDYERTRLTEAESEHFSHFKNNFRVMAQLEGKYLEGIASETASETKAAINTHFNQALGDLSHLSGIQVSEGKLLNDRSKKIIAGSFLLTQFELGVLIAIGLIIMALILESKSFFPKSSQNQSLN